MPDFCKMAWLSIVGEKCLMSWLTVDRISPLIFGCSVIFDLSMSTFMGDVATLGIEVFKAKKAFDDWKDSMGPVGRAIDLLLLGPIRLLSGAIRELNALTGASNLPSGVAMGSPNAGLTASNTGGGNFAPLGPAPVSSTRTPTVVAPLTALSKATASQARRTGGKVVLLG